jgi:hypothetical protein
MKVQHTGSEPVYLPAVDVWVAPRQMVDVPEDVGASLVDQGWVSARSQAAKRTARKRTAKKDPVPVKAQQAEPEPATAEQED